MTCIGKPLGWFQPILLELRFAIGVGGPVNNLLQSLLNLEFSNGDVDGRGGSSFDLRVMSLHLMVYKYPITTTDTDGDCAAIHTKSFVLFSVLLRRLVFLEYIPSACRSHLPMHGSISAAARSVWSLTLEPRERSDVEVLQ